MEIVRYRRATRILHWVHTGAFTALLLTGIILFRPPLEALRETIWIRVVHRAVAAVFIIAPVLYLATNWSAAWTGIKRAFTWGKDDLLWWRAMPRFYLTGKKGTIPPQGFLNGGQKLWWLLTIVLWVIFAVTGIIMAFFKTTAPPDLLKWSIFLHDLSFVTGGVMFLVHLYLAVFHPFMPEAWKAMAGGRVSLDYARESHRKWYEEITKEGEQK